MRKRRALDLFCCGGGTARGLFEAGFDEVVGIDTINHAKSYPGTFVLGDALGDIPDPHLFDLIWASPPCQRFSAALNGKPQARERHPDLIEPTRRKLHGHPYTIIENVALSPVRPDLILTGRQVGLHRLLRRRVFELSFPVLAPPPGDYSMAAGGRPLVTVSTTGGVYSGARRRALAHPESAPDYIRKGRFPKALMAAAMGLPESMTIKEIGEAVPPAYAALIAREALRQMAQAQRIR